MAGANFSQANSAPHAAGVGDGYAPGPGAHTPFRFDLGLPPTPDRQEDMMQDGLAEKCRFIVDAHPTPLLLLNETGEIDLANRAAERVFGRARGDMLGRHIDMLVPGAGQLHSLALARGALAHGECRAIAAGTDPVARRADGSQFPVEIDLSTVDCGGKMVVAAVLDVTARREAGAAKERVALDMAQSNADLQEFAHIASHDLRAPVRAMALLADWIGEDIKSIAGPDTLDNLRLMRQRAARLEMLLDGLLNYTSVGRVKAADEPIELRGLVSQIVESLAPPKGFNVRLAGDVRVVHTPRPPLEHVLQNLIANAIRHHDRTSGEIEVCATRYEGGTEFRVRDDGPGIPPAYHKRIFAIFQTLKCRDDCETSGVGLSIVQKTVEGRGGRVWVESEPPRRGTAFLFTWPDKIK